MLESGLHFEQLTLCYVETGSESSTSGGKETSEEKVCKPAWGELLRLCHAHESRGTRDRGNVQSDLGGLGYSQSLCVSNKLPEANATGPGTTSGEAAAQMEVAALGHGDM